MTATGSTTCAITSRSSSSRITDGVEVIGTALVGASIWSPRIRAYRSVTASSTSTATSPTCSPGPVRKDSFHWYAKVIASNGADLACSQGEEETDMQYLALDVGGSAIKFALGDEQGNLESSGVAAELLHHP